MNTEKERAELLPCPFCGGSVSFHQDDEECRDGCHYIECKTCGTFDLSTAADPTNTVEDLGELRARIAPLWNRRTAMQSPEVQALRKDWEKHEMTTNIDLPEIDEEIIESIFEAADFRDGDVIAVIVKEYATEAVLLNLEKRNE